MVNIGERITELRKRKNWSQSDLAEAIGASRDIIGKYERNENSPSVEMAVKIAKAFDVPVDYLLGEGKHASYSKETVKRIEEIESMDDKTRSVLFNLIDTYIRDAKARKAYS
ncbi:MAG: helix-turn-helix domain-containing protein [Cyclobacteriaceae bacterium]